MRLSSLAGYALALPFSCFLALVPSANAELAKRHVRELESNFMAAYEQGDALGVLESLGKVIRQMSDDEVAELDALLEKQNIEKATRLLVRTRMSLLQQGLGNSLPKPGTRELLLTMSEIDEAIADTQNAVAQHAASMQAAADGDSFERFESLIWDSHVLEQKLGASIELAQYAAELLHSNNRSRSKKITDQERQLLRKDFGTLSQTLQQTLAKVSERESVIRLDRLAFSVRHLEDGSDLKVRYLAARSIDIDGLIIGELLTGPNRPEQFQVERLNDPQLSTLVQQQIKDGLSLAGEGLVNRSRLFFTGLHWWMRGRYGMGTDAYGMLKSEAAVVSDDALFPLYMPEVTPKPTPPGAENPVPELDRRHQYVWAWEYRNVGFNTSPTTTTTSTSMHQRELSRRATSETRMTRFY